MESKIHPDSLVGRVANLTLPITKARWQQG